jgi:uncharacterized protein YaeQ
MGNATTLYRFRIEVSDVDRDHYESLDFRVAKHPSESDPFLMTRVLAYVLNAQPGLEFAPGGLSDTDEPALRVPGPQGAPTVWIEIGNPSARKLHKATKAAKSVKVYTYKDPALLVDEIAKNRVHQAERIELFSFDSAFLAQLAQTLERDNSWGLVHTDGQLSVSVKDEAIAGELKRHSAG